MQNFSKNKILFTVAVLFFSLLVINFSNAATDISSQLDWGDLGQTNTSQTNTSSDVQPSNMGETTLKDTLLDSSTKTNVDAQSTAKSSSFVPYTQTTFIPCQPTAGGTCPEATTPASFINRFYTFAMMIAGLLAFGAITYGGLKYVLAAGNLGSVSEAREVITNAIIGLVLLFGAGIILYTINPQLLNLQNPNLSQLKTGTTSSSSSTSTDQNKNNLVAVEHCITSILVDLPVDITGTDNKVDENGNTVTNSFEKSGALKIEKCLECATGYTLKDNKCEAK